MNNVIINECEVLYTQEDKEVTSAYTRSLYIDFGDYLRFNNSKNDIKHLIPKMDAVLSKRSFEVNTILYRGFGSVSDLFSNKKRERYIIPNIFENIKDIIGKTFTEKSYSSTTNSINVAQGWSGYKEDQGGYLIMNIPVGVNYIDREFLLKDGSNEKEIILERGLSMTITNIDYDNEGILCIFVNVFKG